MIIQMLKLAIMKIFPLLFGFTFSTGNKLSIFAFFLKEKKKVKDMSNLLRFVEEDLMASKTEQPAFGPGDTINVHYKIKEGAKERIQQFQGTVMQIRNVNSTGETFTVRKVSSGVAVERIFPVMSQNIDKIEVMRRGKVRRAKLFYLRGRKGKAARIKEKL
jgi:large subunit ribosomal protein L19